jgi:hypothetical protein
MLSITQTILIILLKMLIPIMLIGSWLPASPAALASPPIAPAFGSRLVGTSSLLFPKASQSRMSPSSRLSLQQLRRQKQRRPEGTSRRGLFRYEEQELQVPHSLLRAPGILARWDFVGVLRRGALRELTIGLCRGIFFHVSC